MNLEYISPHHGYRAHLQFPWITVGKIIDKIIDLVQAFKSSRDVCSAMSVIFQVKTHVSQARAVARGGGTMPFLAFHRCIVRLLFSNTG